MLQLCMEHHKTFLLGVKRDRSMDLRQANRLSQSPG